MTDDIPPASLVRMSPRIEPVGTAAPWGKQGERISRTKKMVGVILRIPGAFSSAMVNAKGSPNRNPMHEVDQSVDRRDFAAPYSGRTERT